MDAMKEVRQSIRETTCTMETWEYSEFMRRLSEWAEEQADMAEYVPDYEPEDD